MRIGVVYLLVPKKMTRYQKKGDDGECFGSASRRGWDRDVACHGVRVHWGNRLRGSTQA